VASPAGIRAGPDPTAIAEGDVDGVADLLHLATELDTDTQVAVTGLRAFGYSWGEIATRTGTTRQAAQQRWGR
jgi:hypothetical protein